MKKIILIKLGGSLISDKTKVNVAKLKEINHLSEQIRKIIDKNKNLSFILATGAGGFGHPLAEKYKDNLEKGWSHIRAAVKKLNQIVVSSLVHYHVPAVSVKPFLISQPKIDKIINLFKAGKIPVFHADLVKDKKGKILVLSMDKFLVDLAIFFKNRDYQIDKVIFAGITSGVIDREGETIKKITKKYFPQIESVFYKGKGIDMTGGMKQKIKECLRLINKKIVSVVINGEKKDSLYRTIVDDKIEGTIIGE